MSSPNTFQPEVLSDSTGFYQDKLRNCFISIQEIYSDLNRLEQAPGLTWQDRRFLIQLEQSLDSMANMVYNFAYYWQFYIERNKPVLVHYHHNIHFLMVQSCLPGYGTSQGECAGLVMDYRRYRKQDPLTRGAFVFKSRVAVLQRNQNFMHPIEDIFLSRVVTCYFSFNLMEQARTLALKVQAYPGESFLIGGFYPSSYGHATYLEYTHEGRFHYYDPNIGALEFDDIQTFCQFYNDYFLGRGLRFRPIMNNLFLITDEPLQNTCFSFLHFYQHVLIAGLIGGVIGAFLGILFDMVLPIGIILAIPFLCCAIVYFAILMGMSCANPAYEIPKFDPEGLRLIEQFKKDMLIISPGKIPYPQYSFFAENPVLQQQEEGQHFSLRSFR